MISSSYLQFYSRSRDQVHGIVFVSAVAARPYYDHLSSDLHALALHLFLCIWALRLWMDQCVH